MKAKKKPKYNRKENYENEKRLFFKMQDKQ